MPSSRSAAESARLAYSAEQTILHGSRSRSARTSRCGGSAPRIAGVVEINGGVSLPITYYSREASHVQCRVHVHAIEVRSVPMIASDCRGCRGCHGSRRHTIYLRYCCLYIR
jgi:hypothetical protein